MNKERILALADFIETQVPAKKFSMDAFGVYNHEIHENKYGLGNCGTAGCIAGWTLVKFKDLVPDVFKETKNVWNSDLVPEMAGTILGLSSNDAYELFYPSWAGKSWSLITKDEAVAHLRKIANE